MASDRGRQANADCWDARGCPDPDDCALFDRCAAEPAEVASSRMELEHELPEQCPMGCGRTTDDVAGGPCKACWDAAPRPRP